MPLRDALLDALLSALPPALRDALLDARSVLFPVDCAGCDSADRSLCDECRAALQPDVTVRSVGGPGPGGVRVHSGARYEGRVRRVILAFKEQGRTDAAAALSRPLAAAVAAALYADLSTAPAAELLLVPTSRAAYRRRGYDPVRLLASRAGLRVARELRQVRATGAQKALGVEQRAANRDGAFQAWRDLSGRLFIVVDDVVTSGATILEVARAVRAAGGEVLGAATLAFTPRLLPFRDIDRGREYGNDKEAHKTA